MACKQCKQNLALRCVLISDPGTLYAGDKTRLKSRIKKRTPHCVWRPPGYHALSYHTVFAGPLVTMPLVTTLCPQAIEGHHLYRKFVIIWNADRQGKSQLPPYTTPFPEENSILGVIYMGFTVC